MKLRNFVFVAAGALLIAPGLFLPIEAGAGMNLNIGINLAPSPYVIPEPPPVAVIPGTYVYYAPDIAVDILFYGGYWYRPVEGRWYRARSYNGPWGYIVTNRVPGALLHLPRDYRHARPVNERIPYGQLKKNWRQWERERHWERAGLRHEDSGWHGGERDRHGEGGQRESRRGRDRID